MLIKNKIKKILEYNDYTDDFFENLIVSISNDKLNYHDTRINTTLSIKLSKLDFYKELKNIDLNQNMNKVDKHILKNLINKFKTLDLSKIVNFFYDFRFYYNSYAEFLYFSNEEIEKAVKKFKFNEYEVEIGHC